MHHSLDPAGTDREVLDFVSGITDSARMRIEENLPHGFVRLKVAEAERRQAQHDIRSVEDIVTELLRNSRDAGATNILVAFQKEQGRYRKITVIDDGCGIPEDMHRMVFEPRVTSKSRDFEEDRYGVHGRGMALFSIRSRVPDARVLLSEPDRGTAIGLTADTAHVQERSDQASLPRLEKPEGEFSVGGGPHNVPRVLLEMSVDSPGIDFYIGSFAEVLATLRKLGPGETVPPGPIWADASAVEDAKELAVATGPSLGLPVSERNAYRIMAGEVPPLEPVYAQALAQEDAVQPRLHRVQAGSSHRGKAGARSPLRRIVKQDMDTMARESRAIVDDVLEKYFLKVVGSPRARRSRGRILISFFVSGDEEE